MFSLIESDPHFFTVLKRVCPLFKNKKKKKLKKKKREKLASSRRFATFVRLFILFFYLVNDFLFFWICNNFTFKWIFKYCIGKEKLVLNYFSIRKEQFLRKVTLHISEWHILRFLSKQKENKKRIKVYKKACGEKEAESMYKRMSTQYYVLMHRWMEKFCIQYTCI